MKRGIILLTVLVMALCSSLYADVAVTVYNQNLAVVKDQRQIDFQKGKFEYSLVDVPSQIDPTSVHFKLLKNPDAVDLLEQNYRYDLVSFGKILDRYLDQNIDLVHEDGQVYSGILLAHDGNTITLMKADNSLEVIQTDKITKFNFPELPEGLITRPTLVWQFNSDLSGPQNSEISYMTKGMNWHAEYVGIVSNDDKSLDLSAWVSVENNSGGSYKDAKLKLVAGDVNIVQPPRGRQGMGYEADMVFKGTAGFEEKPFFEYHLYTLPRTTSLANSEIKQISLFEPATTPVVKNYVYEGGGKDVRVELSFTNSEEDGLGMPLPAGKVRVMKKDSDGSMEFVGENMIDHTPRDEKVDLTLGNAFDLVGERVIKDSRQISRTSREDDVEITLRNHKDKEPVEILVKEHFGPFWKILKSNYEYNKTDANTAEFKIPVQAGQEVTLSYTVRIGN